jgi:hypothetical protein
MKKKSSASSDAPVNQANSEPIVEKDTGVRKRGWSLGASKSTKVEEKPVAAKRGRPSKSALAAKDPSAVTTAAVPESTEKPRRGRPPLIKAEPVLRSIRPAVEPATEEPAQAESAAPVTPAAEKPRRGRPVGSVKSPAAKPVATTSTKGKRGRPAKAAPAVSSLASATPTDTGDAPKSKRGRPPKAKTIETNQSSAAISPAINPQINTFAAEPATIYVASDELSEKIIRLEKRILKIQKKLIKLKRKVKA